MVGPALPADERPIDPTPVHTADLPPTPIRDRNIPATAWIEAPDELLHLGDDIDQPLVTYKRRIGRWLLWRAGPASRSRRPLPGPRRRRPGPPVLVPAVRRRPGEGVGPSGTRHTRFRAWKEDLLPT